MVATRSPRLTLAVRKVMACALSWRKKNHQVPTPAAATTRRMTTHRSDVRISSSAKSEASALKPMTPLQLHSNSYSGWNQELQAANNGLKWTNLTDLQQLAGAFPPVQ